MQNKKNMKSTKKTLAAWMFCLPLGMMSLTSLAQTENLVPNGSFESTSNKVKKLGQIELATGWVSPTGVRADLFTPASKIPEIGTPDNAYGTEAPAEGKNYAGIVTYSYNDKQPRSYVMAKFSTPLKKGMTYCVSFNVSLAELSKYASNQIGAHISKRSFGTEEKVSIIEKTHVLQSENKVFNALYGWDKVCGVYVAEGGEKYITIGNFSNNDEVNNEKNKKPDYVKGTPIIASYYYLDDVSVVLLDNGQKCDCGGNDDLENVSSTIYQSTVTLKGTETPTQKIEMQTAYFAFGKDRLQPQVMSALDLIVAEMKANPSFKLQIIGHSDEKEVEMAKDKAALVDIDKQRASAVAAYLMDKGVFEHRIVISNEANNDPSGADETDEDLKWAKDRRVTFKVRQQ